jgi:hypothetical protein
VLVASGRYACLLLLLSTTKIYVFPPRTPTLPAGFIVKPQLSHRDTQEAVGVADARGTPGRSTAAAIVNSPNTSGPAFPPGTYDVPATTPFGTYA